MLFRFYEFKFIWILDFMTLISMTSLMTCHGSYSSQFFLLVSPLAGASLPKCFGGGKSGLKKGISG